MFSYATLKLSEPERKFYLPFEKRHELRYSNLFNEFLCTARRFLVTFNKSFQSSKLVEFLSLAGSIAFYILSLFFILMINHSKISFTYPCNHSNLLKESSDLMTKIEFRFVKVADCWQIKSMDYIGGKSECLQLSTASHNRYPHARSHICFSQTTRRPSFRHSPINYSLSVSVCPIR